MKLNDELHHRVERYLAEVAANLQHLPSDEREDVLDDLKAHIHDALDRRCPGAPGLKDVDAVLAEMAAPESFAASNAASQAIASNAHTAQAHLHRPSRPTIETKQLIAPTLRVVFIHLLLPLGLFVFLTYKVPDFARMFSEMDVALPTITRCVLAVSRAIGTTWWLFLPAMLFLLAADGGVYLLLRRFGHKGIATLWFVGVFFAQVACAAFCALGVLLPLEVLMDNTA